MAEASLKVAKKRDRESKRFHQTLLSESQKEREILRRRNMKTPEKAKTQPFEDSLLNTPVLTESQLLDISKPLRRTRYMSYVRELWLDPNVSDDRAVMDADYIWTTPGSGFAGDGCIVCDQIKTCCDSCLFFLPKNTRRMLFERLGRKEGQHLCGFDGICSLCQLVLPQNQQCSGNHYLDSGDCVGDDKKFRHAVESRWEEMVRAGVDLPPRARELVDKDLYGCAKKDLQENLVVRKKTENLLKTENLILPSIPEVIEPESAAKLKKAMVSLKSICLPTREIDSAETEQWPLRAGVDMRIEARDTKNIKTLIELCGQASVPSCLRVRRLRQDHWLSSSLTSALSIKTGVIREGQSGRIKVSVHNKTDNSIDIKKGSVIGMIQRENYLDMD